MAVSSVDDDKVLLNILNHLASEEGYAATPYPDPNMRQANIGFGHSFHFFSPAEIVASRKYADKKQRWAYLKSQIPKEKLMQWGLKKAKQELKNDYTTHRNRAQSWLDSHDMGEDGRLVDQLGMLFFGATGGDFMKSSSAQKAIKNKDYDALSRAASMWGRYVNGKIENYAVKRRVAERNFYTGNELPIRKNATTMGTESVGRMPRPPKPAPGAPRKGLDLFRSSSSLGGAAGDGEGEGWLPGLDFDLFSSPDLTSDFTQDFLGEAGVKAANEAAWKILHGTQTPMEEGFDAVQWASSPDAVQYVPRNWRETMDTYGIETRPPVTTKGGPTPQETHEEMLRKLIGPTATSGDSGSGQP
jgi:GH24 family phage-related lysozyme (muramidase)